MAVRLDQFAHPASGDARFARRARDRGAGQSDGSIRLRDRRRELGGRDARRDAEIEHRVDPGVRPIETFDQRAIHGTQSAFLGPLEGEVARAQLVEERRFSSRGVTLSGSAEKNLDAVCTVRPLSGEAQMGRSSPLGEPSGVDSSVALPPPRGIRQRTTPLCAQRHRGFKWI